ncbi:cell receptor beta chain [Podarcis lilfordi]|uniref:Cell receptor beta chain n=1 Tax=Podarcis lilfordi TaxID=74358 RepID=A0AA35PU18_9SAUR|nr:cell receptor beta chain [Podarcis lilfordi]
MLLRLGLARWGKCLLKCSFTPVSSHFLLTLLFSSGSAVQQTSDTIVRGNEEVLLRCFQEKTTFSYMYWYKQEGKKDPQLQLVAFSVEGFGGSDIIQKEFEGRFESRGMNGYVFNLTLKEAKPSDAGTYFCAKQDNTVSQLHRKPDTNPFIREYT